MTVTTGLPVRRRRSGPPRCAVVPATAPLAEAVVAGGGEVVGPEAAEAVIWTDPSGPGGLDRLLEANPGIVWVQLPYAGVEPFRDVIDDRVTWTCGKGVYAEPVAEHALALLLAGFRHVVGYARTRTWTRGVGRNLLGARVTVLGGGAITEVLLRLLAPFGCPTTVVRRHPAPLPGTTRVVGPDDLDTVLPDSDAVVLALALTPETERVLDSRRLALLPDHAWVVNVARGRHVDTDALVAALEAGRLGGAALDVTDPEPLPDAHPLWRLDNVVITPHTANTPEMGLPLLQRRVTDNVRRFAAGEPLLGPVDPVLKY